MKRRNSQMRFSLMLLCCSMLLQSCSVYRTTSVPLDETLVSKEKVLIKENNGKALIFEKIKVEDGKYYGLKKSRGEMIKIHIKQDNLSRVSLKNKSLSTILSVGIPAVIIGSLIAIGADSCCGIKPTR